jgi:NAD(P)-dependent dehydrogenase (short-subunit alcohol dehydrogenase family)
MANDKRAGDAIRKQRDVQKRVDRTGKAKDKPDQPKGAMQAGARYYPEPPFPRQHQAKPGDESALDPPPMYEAPFYRGSQKLSGKIALVTGGDSGIGRAVSVLFAREGAHVAISYLAETKDAKDARDAIENEGGKCLLLPGDVSDAGHCRRIVEQVVTTFGGLDILVNNAAFQYHAGSLEELTPEHFDLTLKTNLYGYFNMAREAVPHMKNGSAIINTGSVTGIDGSKELIDYSMTKGGIHAFTRALASNLIPRGIRVNAVAPGPVWTPLNPSEKAAEDVAEFGARTPMRRPAQPEEIAPAYVFFASSHCSSYITGEILPIIGGY